jgi:hypothetical protein
VIHDIVIDRRLISSATMHACRWCPQLACELCCAAVRAQHTLLWLPLLL